LKKKKGYILKTISICNKEYTISNDINNLLEVLVFIRENIDSSLGFKFNCKSGVCGSCSVVVNGSEKLACSYNIAEGDVIAPLKNLPVLKDLIVDSSNIENKLKSIDTNLSNNEQINQNDIDSIDIESNCILCNSCYSSCPVYAYNPDFIGPFALTKAYRYINDKKDTSSTKDKVDNIQEKGVWDCTLCGNCSAVCPQSIDIKTDIQTLQNLSVQNGFQNPMFTMGGGFGGDFGFNPNGF
jgi:fumarate reductase iron-sulfur subunit